ncbi:hypothetical protein ES703_22304 [subsurface metagenome]
MMMAGPMRPLLPRVMQLPQMGRKLLMLLLVYQGQEQITAQLIPIKLKQGTLLDGVATVTQIQATEVQVALVTNGREVLVIVTQIMET